MMLTINQKNQKWIWPTFGLFCLIASHCIPMFDLYQYSNFTVESAMYCISRNFHRKLFSRIWLGHTFASFLFSRLSKGNCMPGGTDLERGYADVRPWRPPFHASPAARKDPISSKRVSSQDPLLRKFGNFSLYSLNFHPNFSSKAPKFGNFQLTSPQIWKFSAHKPQILKFSAHKAPPF